jgi:SAM-dependent methyltransferase
MQDSSKQVVLKIIKSLKPSSILDVPCGNGWLPKNLNSAIQIDGVDLYGEEISKYRKWEKFDLNNGLPASLGTYDCIISCEGLEHFGNPELFLRTAYTHLNSKGIIILTTPNVWYPQSKLQYLLRGFFPSFPCLTGKINKGDHMHIIPWSFSQLYLFLTLTSFKDICLHYEPLSEPKHFYEKILGFPQLLYCRSKFARAVSEEERVFWDKAGSKESIYGRHLIITAVKS